MTNTATRMKAASARCAKCALRARMSHAATVAAKAAAHKCPSGGCKKTAGKKAQAKKVQPRKKPPCRC